MRFAPSIVLFLFTLSGVAGLVYEIVWIRMLSHLLGGTSYAISTVLAAFMGGLALGSRHFGKRADRVQRPLWLYVKLEFGIALLGLLVYLLIRVSPPAYVAIAGVLPEPVLGLLRAVIAFALILPPTFLMGGTLPVLSRFIVRSGDRLGRGLGTLYAVNTLGAVLGSFLAGFVLVASFGTQGSVAIAVAINVVVGLVVWMLERSTTSEPATESDEVQLRPPSGKSGARVKEPATQMNYAVLMAVFAMSGFASLGYEIYWTRALQHFLGNSTYAFSAMLTTFLLGLAAGGWVGGRIADRSVSPPRVLAWIQLSVGAFAALSVVLIWEWLPHVADSAWLSMSELEWNTYIFRKFLVALAVMALPTFLTGMTFPIVNRIGIHSVSRVGVGVGTLYFANTIGAIVGSLFAGFILLPALGSKGALIATSIFSAALGLAVAASHSGRRMYEPIVAAVVVLAMFFAAPALKRSGRTLFADSQTATDRVLFETEDHAAETRVYKALNGEMHMSVDGHDIGGTEWGILRKEKILAHLPMVLRPDARRTLSVGLGSGITLGTLAMYKSLETLTCVEIVPGVVEGAAYFANDNGGVLHDPRTNIHVGDGVQFLLTTRDRFDIISSDSKLNPEYAGNAPLLSRDYYALCRDRLTDTGVMVQWLAVHLPVGELMIISRSFAEAFPHVGLYWFDPYNLILAGSRAPIVLGHGCSTRIRAG